VAQVARDALHRLAQGGHFALQDLDEVRRRVEQEPGDLRALIALGRRQRDGLRVCEADVACDPTAVDDPVHRP
jgi:hypothetical protein